MTLDEAIKHCLEVAEKEEQFCVQDDRSCLFQKSHAECAADHRQLAEWLMELKELSLQIEAPRLGSIEEYHYELAKCKTAFWSCNKSCMDAQEQYRRKADELRKAQEQIAEYKRLLKAAIEDINTAEACNTCKYYPVINSDACQRDDCYKWRYADEALKLIGGSEK